MGGRGGSSGLSGINPNSADYKNAYADEMGNAREFTAAFALTASASTIGWEMHAYQSVTGRSLIADTQAEVKSLKESIKEVDVTAAYVNSFYGKGTMSKDTVSGTKAAIKEKIALREKAIKKMTDSRSEYEKYKREAQTGNAKAKKRGGKYM
ncbi:MAG: hypothetical protein IJD49_04255 [Clostridia bacterium]|nr:hypothetical protein [Clostridia bacterium]